MKLNIKAGTVIAAVGALVMAVPAAAHPGPSDHSNGGSHANGASHPSKSHKCMPHNVAYVEGGTIDAATPSTLTANADGTWSGTLVVDVTTANHAARADRHQTVTYTFTDAKLRVRFDGGTTAFTAGERVKLIGKEATVAKKCTALSPAATPVFRRLVVHPAS